MNVLAAVERAIVFEIVYGDGARTIAEANRVPGTMRWERGEEWPPTLVHLATAAWGRWKRHALQAATADRLPN
jgi:hypothetical protein